MSDENIETQADEAESQDGAEGAGEIEALRAENAVLKEQALRYAAEAENTKRRAEREMNDARAFAIQRFGRDLLDAADSLARAVQAAPKESADAAVKNLVLGIEMTEKALQSAFDRNGLKKVDPAKGEAFDPNKHQAMMEQPADGVPPGSVIMVMQAGYELFGRLVRPALVAVTPKAAAAAAQPDGYAQSDAPNEPSVDTKA